MTAEDVGLIISALKGEPAGLAALLDKMKEAGHAEALKELPFDLNLKVWHVYRTDEMVNTYDEYIASVVVAPDESTARAKGFYYDQTSLAVKLIGFAASGVEEGEVLQDFHEG